MTDPGAWSTAQNDQKNIHLVLITHEHPDHFHLDSLKTVLTNNSQAQVITNSAVGKLMDEVGIKYQLLEHGESKQVNGMNFEGYGQEHAIIYENIGQVLNTGFMIGDRLFYPGDALYNPKRPVEILALPVAGPWVKISEAIDYAKELKPKYAFPVHDGLLKIYSGHHTVPQRVLPECGIDFKVLEELKEYEY